MSKHLVSILAGVVLLTASLSASDKIDPENTEIQYNLGVMWRDGDGVRKNYAEALKWFRKAAEQGDADAQNNLGLCYAKGSGVAKDYVEAHKWLNLASAKGSDSAKENLILAEKRMTTRQIAEAQLLAREIKPRKTPQPEVMELR